MRARLGRAFIPRADSRRGGTRPLGWETSLVGWSGLFWGVHFTRWAALEDPARRALTGVARRLTKRSGHPTVETHPGGVRTSRPVGTRMGKGKGKPDGHRVWLARGDRLLAFRGPRPSGWSLLGKRSPGGARLGRTLW